LKITAPKDGYCHDLPNRSAVERKIEADRRENPVIMEKWREHLPHIEAFANPVAETATQKLEALLRIVNGKAFFQRIKTQAKFTDDIHFDVATQMRQLNLIPPEIKAFVEKCKA
jgi:hypothetical protein